MGARTGSATLFRVADRDPAVTDCGDFACEISGVVTDTHVLTGVVFVGLAVLVALAYIENANKTCRHERRRVLDERDAFTEFADRVDSLNPVSAESSSAFADGPSTGLHRELGSENTADATLRQVLSIYRETVMSAPHYEVEYDETVPESMAAELGPDMVTSLAANGTLSPAAQCTIVDRSHEAVAARASLVDAIDTELDALSGANAELTAIDRCRSHLMEHLAEVRTDETGAAIDVWNQLDDLETEAETPANERQQSLREPPMEIDPTISDTGEIAFYDYLYGDTEGPRHPVLSQVMDLIATIRENRDHAASRIAKVDDILPRTETYCVVSFVFS